MGIFSITTEIRNILLADEEIVRLTEGKVFPVYAPADTKGDFIVYQRDGFKEEDTKMGLSMQTPYVFVSVVSENYDRSQQLAQRVYDTLEGEWREPYMLIRLADSTEGYEAGKYIQVLEFSIKTLRG